MDTFGEQHCRLCLSTLNVNEEHFKEIKHLTESTFDILLLKLNLDNSSKYVTCDVCSRSLLEAFRFKSMCIYTNNTIIPYVGGETDCPLDLKEIYKNESRKKHLIQTLDDYKVCRLCMQLIKDKFVPAHGMAVDMIEMYIPEVDPVICRHCFDSLVNHSTFIKNCLEINDKIESFPHAEIADTSIWMSTVDSYIKTEEVDIKSENVQKDKLFESDSTMIYEEISSEVDPLKLEDESEESELPPIIDNVLADIIDQHNPSQDNKDYFNTGHTYSRQLKNQKMHKVKEFQRDTCNSRCKQKCSLKRNLLKPKDISKREEFQIACNLGTKQKSKLKIHHLKHKTRFETKVLECDICDFKTKHKNSLKVHQLAHKDISEMEVLECDIYDFKTKHKKSLERYQLTNKDISEVEIFKCDICDFKTKRKNSLKRHQLTHKDITEVKLFHCDICDFKTKHEKSLKGHQLLHKDISEVEGFQCDICDFKTKHKQSLKKHQLTHKDISEVKVFECDTCDFKSKFKDCLKRHQLTHKVISEVVIFQCNMCNYKSNRESSIKQHQLTHKDISEVEVFECDTCEFKTKHKKYLKEHQLTHKDISEVKVFECATCSYKTKFKRYLKRHQLKHSHFQSGSI